MIKPIIATLAGLLLAGCTTAYPGSPQTYAGINHGKFHIDPKTGAVDIEVMGGKEGEDVAFTIEGPSGLKATYTAKTLNAAAAQAQQAAANAAIMEKLAGSADKLIDKIPGGVP